MTDASPTKPASAEPFVFASIVPLVNNRFMWWDFLKVVAISTGSFAILIPVATLLAGNEPFFLPWQAYVIIPGAFSVLWVVACLLMGNRYAATFTIDVEGVRYESGGREQDINTAVTYLGILAGKPGMAGAGALASSEGSGLLTWHRIRRLNIHSGQHVISVRNSWRVVVRMYVPPQVWDDVVRRMQTGVAAA